MKTTIVVALVFILIYLFIMLVCTFKVKSKIKDSFRCGKCLRMNKEITKKCSYCGNGMQSGYNYKSTFFGHRDCKNESGNLDYLKTNHHISVDLFIWSGLIAVSIVLLIVIAVLM